VDIGAGKTSVVVYLGSLIKAMVVLPFGGNLVTNDISVGANIDWDKAEKAKQIYGSPMVDLQNNNLLIFNKNKSADGKQLTFKTLAYIIEARMTEILANVFYQIKENVDLGMLRGGVVLTGEAAKLKDLGRFVKLKYTLDVREGGVNNVKIRGLSSANEANHNVGSLSLTLWANSECTRKNEFKSLNESKGKQAKKPKVERTGNLFGNLLQLLITFLKTMIKKCS
jgi:cell division protein FtsA